MAVALVTRLMGLTTTRSWRFLTRQQQEKMLTRVLKEESMPDVSVKQPKPPQMLMIDLHNLLTDEDYRYLPRDRQVAAIESVLEPYVAEYKPCAY